MRGVVPVRTLVPGGVRISGCVPIYVSFRTSPQTGVGISIEFRAAYRHTDRSFALFSVILPREVVRLFGGLPRQCDHWLAMTGISIARQIPICLHNTFRQ